MNSALVDLEKSKKRGAVGGSVMLTVIVMNSLRRSLRTRIKEKAIVFFVRP